LDKKLPKVQFCANILRPQSHPRINIHPHVFGELPVLDNRDRIKNMKMNRISLIIENLFAASLSHLRIL